MAHETFRAGDLTAVIGDNEAYQGHRSGYNGVHRLTHRTNPSSLFTVAGINLEHIFDGDQDLRGDVKVLFEPRHFPMTLTKISDSEAELHQQETPTFHLESWTRFKLVAPHYIDITFRCKPFQHVFKHGYIGLFWASYIDDPENKSIYFRDDQGWVQLCTQTHSNQSTVVPLDNKVELKFTPQTRQMLYNNFSPLRFSDPIYYGLLGTHQYILMFDRTDGIRFAHSPSAGGPPSATEVAWDWQFIMPTYDVLREYGYHARAVYRERCSRAEVLKEFRTWRASLEGASMKALSPALALFLLLVPARVWSQENAARRHERLLEHLKKTAAEISARSLLDIRTLADWQGKRPSVRRELLYMLGLDPLPERTLLKAEVKGTLERAPYRVEKVVYQSLPGLYVTGNFYLPKKPAPPLPAILYVCGHSPHPLGAKWSYQDRAIWFAEHGYACLVLDTLEFGEVPGIHHGIHDLNLWNWLSLGYTPVGVEVWNAIRGVDYLESRPEVDRSRIGMTGISGGGAVTWFTAAVDDRIASAAPVCSTYTFGSQAAHWVASGQCDCIYFHNTFLEDFPIVGALIAPRPLCICSGRKDPDFPPDGYHEVFRRVKKIYDLYAGTAGEPDRVREVDDDVGHSDVPLFRKEARQWMNRWLKGDPTPLDVEPLAKDQRETPEALACLTKLPADAVNYKIHDLFIPVARAGSWTSLPDWKGRRQELVKELREKVFRWFPRAKIPFAARVGRDKGGWAAQYADYKEVFFDTEPGVSIRARLLKPRKHTRETPLLLYVKRPIDSIYPLDLDELLPVLGRATVVILNPRLTEHPVSPFEVAEIERSASWIGRTVASMQVWDILRAVEWAAGEEKIAMSSVIVYGKGEMGILGLYAALFDDRIGQVILKDPPASHRQGPALLNVLRVTDIAEVAAVFAPRKLVVLGKIPAPFEYARGIYGLHERPENLTSAGSMPEAMEIWKY